MLRVLRGHHVLCVHGFQGMGYSPDFVKKMTEIVEEIRDDHFTFPIQVVNSFDECCHACPHKGEIGCEASIDSDAHVKEIDRRIMEHLGLVAGNHYDKDQLVRLTAEKVKPDDLDVLCEGCSWLPYGVCKEGIARLNEKYKK
jgi:hypothetical protein